MGRHIDMKKHMFRRQLESKLRQRFETEANQLTDQDRQRMALIKPSQVDINKPAPFIPRPSIRRPAAKKNVSQPALDKFESEYQAFIAKLRAKKAALEAEQKPVEPVQEQAVQEQVAPTAIEETAPVVEQPVQTETVAETTDEAPVETTVQEVHPEVTEQVKPPKKSRKKKKTVIEEVDTPTSESAE